MILQKPDTVVLGGHIPWATLLGLSPNKMGSGGAVSMDASLLGCVMIMVIYSPCCKRTSRLQDSVLTCTPSEASAL